MLVYLNINKMLQWETVDRNAFAVFIRDLSVGTNINLKHMIEDMDKKVEKKVVKKLKKKDIIIMEQDKKRDHKRSEDEKKMIKYMIENINNTTIYTNLNKLHLEESKLYYKCEQSQ